MIKKTLFVFLLLLLSIQTYAQRRLDVPEFYVGASAGATASMVMFSPTVDQSYHLGMNAGAAFRYIGDKNVGVQVELNFTQLGWQEQGTSTYERTLNYLEIPFLTHVHFGRKVGGFFNFGPKINLLIGENSRNLPSAPKPQHNKADNIFDYGLCAGLGMSVNTGNAGRYQLEARFAYSLGNVFDNRKTDYFGMSNIMALSLNLGWFFRFK